MGSRKYRFCSGTHLSSWRKWAKAVGDLVWDFRHTLLVVLLVLAFCAVTQTAMWLDLVSLDQLAASRSNPSGVVTAIFTHWDWSLLLENAESLLFFTGLFVISNYPRDRAERVRRGRWFAALVFPIAVVVNLVDVLRSPSSSQGASGLVFAGLGIAFALFLTNTMDEASDLIRPAHADRAGPQGRWERFRTVCWFAVNGSLFLSFLILALSNQAVLFGTGDVTINASAHALGFVLGVIATLVWHFSWARSKVPG